LPWYFIGWRLFLWPGVLVLLAFLTLLVLLAAGPLAARLFWRDGLDSLI
jgi:hypothetical protein